MEVNEWEEALKQLKECLEGIGGINSRDLVNFCVENKTVRNAAEDFLKKVKKLKLKDSALALQAKEKGNENCRKKNYRESLSLYTISILLAENNNVCLPLAYSNRSIVLQKMGHPLESLSDIDMALASGYPKEKLEMLMLRKSKCLVQLGNVEEAKKVLENALKNSEKKELHQVIKTELQKISNLKNQKNLNSENKLPEVVGGENENFVSASKHLSVYYDEARGRHVIATKDLEIGDVLLVEKPFVFIVFDICFNCAKNTIAPIPCLNCPDAYYCSPKCRDDFWKSIHSFECGYVKLFKSIGMANLSLRIILKASSSLGELKKVLNEISEPKYESGLVMFTNNGYDGVYNLLHHTKKISVNELFQYVMTSLLLALYLKNCTNYFPAVSDDKDLNLLTSVLYRHTMQSMCNGHAIADALYKWTDEKSELKMDKLKKGAAIYVSASMMNHSCESSIFNFFHNNWLIVRAAKAIKKGEEVFNCYGSPANSVKRSVRQKVLRDNYFFKCKCQCCLQTVDIQDKLTAFKCIYCKGPSILKTEISGFIVCINCEKTCKFSQVRKKMDNFYALIKEGEVLHNDDVTLSLKKFVQAWWIGRDIFYKFHKDLTYAAKEVARCLLVLGDYRRCILFLKCCILSIKERFGSVSLQHAGELEELGSITLKYVVSERGNSTAELVCQGLQCYREAEKIFTLLCGPDFKMLKKITKNKEILEKLLSC